MKEMSLLIVEDDAMVLEVNKQFIETLSGFNIIGTAKNGQEAIQAILDKKPQLVVLDFYLPDFNGLEVIKKVRMSQEDTDFILVTAARDVETIQQVFRFGAIDYIIKPFRFDRLKTALERYEQMILRLKGNEQLDQKDLDKMVQSLKDVERNTGLPKGLNEITMKQILHYLVKAQEPLSADEVAKGTGLARVTVRRYLEYLAKSNKLKIEIQYGSIGRPINRYFF